MILKSKLSIITKIIQNVMLCRAYYWSKILQKIDSRDLIIPVQKIRWQ